MSCVPRPQPPDFRRVAARFAGAAMPVNPAPVPGAETEAILRSGGSRAERMAALERADDANP